ncbi:hypothetical protein [Deinococcus planocerae]|uniref:hypothetical protein n=1 Tax=Deinococcus planocerae TaxID=1737569 RepID=UPI000C7F4492|nr:hypothetical protein [Deinococcus planocerae]
MVTRLTALFMLALSFAAAAPSEVLYSKQLDFRTDRETRVDLDLGAPALVGAINTPGEYVFAPRVSFLFQKLRPTLPAPFAPGYILNEVPFRVVAHYRVYAQSPLTPSVLSLVLPLDGVKPGDLLRGYLWDGEQYTEVGHMAPPGALVALAQFSPRLTTKNFGYGTRVLVVAVDKRRLTPVCQKRGGTVQDDWCNASGWPAGRPY